jgi:hypothetical protein
MKGTRAASSLRTCGHGCCYTRARTQLKLDVIIVPADGISAADEEETETSVDPRFTGSSRTSQLLVLYTLLGVPYMKRNSWSRN